MDITIRKKISETLKRKGIKPPVWKGMKFTDEHKANISNSLKGRTVWNYGIKIDKKKYPKMGHHNKHSENAKHLMKINHRGTTGKKFSEESKIKMSISQKKVIKPTGEKSNNWRGGKPECEICGKKLSSYKNKRCVNHLYVGKKVWNKGIKISKISGEKHWNWKGGITPENLKIRLSIEYRLWRESVFARDNWTCQKTKEKGVELHPHHIENFSSHPELRFAIDNGITLSKKAHNEFHHKYGRKNNTREQINEYNQNKQYAGK